MEKTKPMMRALISQRIERKEIVPVADRRVAEADWYTTHGQGD